MNQKQKKATKLLEAYKDDLNLFGIQLCVALMEQNQILTEEQVIVSQKLWNLCQDILGDVECSLEDIKTKED